MLLVAPEADLLGFRLNFVLSYSVLVPLTMLVALRPWQTLRVPVPRQSASTTADDANVSLRASQARRSNCP